MKNNITMNIVFSELKIVTITVNAILPIDIDYKNFVLFVNKTSEFIPKVMIDKNVEFYNCFSFKIDINGNVLNVKYFKNGSLQITGCKNVENITILILLLVKHINNNKDDLIEINPSNYKAIKLLEKYKINECAIVLFIISTIFISFSYTNKQYRNFSNILFAKNEHPRATDAANCF